MNFFESPKNIFMGFYVLLLNVSFVLFFKARKELKQKEIKTGKKWLFEDNACSTNILLLFILGLNISTSIIYGSKIEIWQNVHSIIASSVLVLITLYIFIQLKIIPKKVAEELEKTYPEYKFE